MAELNIEGYGTVSVDDAFRNLSPEDQNATVGEIIQSLESNRSFMDRLTGKEGPRYQTWPERMGREMIDMGKGAVTLPGDVMRGETPIYDDAGHVSPDVVRRSTDTALLFGPSAVASRTLKAPGAPMKSNALLTEEAARRFGVELPRPVTGGASTRVPARAMQDVPFVGAPLKQGAERAISQIDDAARAVAERAGSGDAAQAGGMLKAELSATAKTRIPEFVSSKYDEVGKLVDDNIFVPLAKTQQAVKTLLSRRQNAALDGEGKAIQMVRDAVSRPQGMNYEGIKTLRTTIGEMLDTNTDLIAAGFSKGELKQIYAALSDDLATSVQKAGGKDAAALFESANTTAAAAAKMREIIQKAVGPGEGKSEENIIGFVQRIAGSNNSANSSLLLKLKGAAGGAWDEVSSAIVSRMGRNSRGEFQAGRFVSDYEKLSDAGKTALFGGAKSELRAAVDDIARVSRVMEEYGSTGSTSNSANPLVVTLGILGFGGAGTFGGFPGVAAYGTGVLGARGLSSALARPRSAAQVSKWAKAYERALTNPTPGNLKLLKNRSNALAIAGASRTGPTKEAAMIAEQLIGGVIRSDPTGEQNKTLMESYRNRPFGPDDA